MKSFSVYIKALLLIFLFFLVKKVYSSSSDEYQYTVIKPNQVLISKAGFSLPFTGKFIIIYREDDPKLELKNFVNYRYFSSSWATNNLSNEKKIRVKNPDISSGGDGIDNNMSAVENNRTFDLFYAGKNEVISPNRISQTDSIIRFIYPSKLEYEFSAWIECPEKGDLPLIKYVFKPKRSGYYSIGYLGAPSYDPKTADEFWQPMVWQQKRFPEQSFLSLAFQCPVPATMVNVDSQTIGLIVPPTQFDYDPLPTRYNNKFGVALRSEEGLAQPMIFSPVLGSKGSYLNDGEIFSFCFKLFIENAPIPETFKKLVEYEYGFEDYRSNALGSLNATVDNMVDYALSPYSQFIDSLKGCSYSTDVPGATKNVSSLHPLEIALLTDNEDIFTKRALPIFEYMLSRKNSLFCLDPLMKIQNPSRSMDGPCASYSELISLFALTNKSMPYLKEWISRKYPEEKQLSWQNAMVAFQTLKDNKYLEIAQKGAKKYIEENIEIKANSLSKEFFWSSFAPAFMPLYEMYETTGDSIYLESAHKAAYYYSMFIWFSPKIPNVNITVNKDGEVPMYWYLASKGHKQMYLQEEVVPAWRTSEIGLLPESSTTSIGHRGVFMAHHAPFMMRIAENSDDSFMRNIARSTIIGRYTNFPGYHINTARTTVYEKPEYPNKEPKDLSYNSFHYNHIYPNISLLFDYLISDVYDRSNKLIDFPSFFIEGYAYLCDKFYGHQQGSFYDYKDVKLWMPKSLIKTESPELNYLSGRNHDDLFIAFTNQSKESIGSDIFINTDLLPQLKNKEYVAELWIENLKSDAVKVVNGRFRLPVKSKGITAVIIKDVGVVPKFQDRLFDNQTVWTNGKRDIKIGNSTAMIIDMGKGLKKMFVYLRDSDETIASANLSYIDPSGKTNTLIDSTYPFEFSIPLKDDIKSFTFSLGIVDKNNKLVEEENIILSE